MAIRVFSIIDSGSFRAAHARWSGATTSGGFGARLVGLVFLLIAAVVMVAALVIAVPLVLGAAALGMLAYGIARARRALAGLWSPNGMMDGRRNVRVMTERASVSAVSSADAES